MRWEYNDDVLLLEHDVFATRQLKSEMTFLKQTRSNNRKHNTGYIAKQPGFAAECRTKYNYIDAIAFVLTQISYMCTHTHTHTLSLSTCICTFFFVVAQNIGNWSLVIALLFLHAHKIVAIT